MESGSKLTTAVVICAYTEDRWQHTLDAVRSVLEQDDEPDEFVLVVDHNPQLAERFRRELRGVVVVENELSPGLSGARNTGILRTRSEIVAFLDDDAVAERRWLGSLKSVYLEDPHAVAVGGSVLPKWPGRKPLWFPDEFGWVVGASYLGQPTQRSAVRNVFGCNMSVRRPADGILPMFSGGIGRIGRRPLGGEETPFLIELVQASTGGRVVYDPSITISHVVDPERATLRYFVSRCWFEGRSKAAVASIVGSQALSVERAYVRCNLSAGVVRRILHSISSRDVKLLEQAAVMVFGLVVTTAGYLVGTVLRWLSFERRE